MKIIFLNVHQFQVSRGAETFVFEMAKRLSEENSVEIISKINYWELIKKDFDVIIPTNGRLQAMIVRIITWIKGAKMIISGQSGIGADDKINLLTFPDIFIGLTKYQTDWARKVNPFVNAITIPNGVNLQMFSRNKKRSRDVVVSVGAFTREKRHDLTIKAVAELENIKLLIAGSPGDYKDELLRLAEAMIPGRYQFISVDYTHMSSVYEKGGVFAYSTVPWESFGISIVEAMASGLPVVVTDDPIRKEIVGNAGILIDPADSKEYGSALKKALQSNWDLKPESQAKKFSWDLVAKRYEELLKKFIQEKK